MVLEKNFRVTRQRRIILDEMSNMRRHPTAGEVYDAVRRRLPRISLGTVYRNLELLSEKGVIAKIRANGPQMRFDINPGEHYHAHCTRCGAILDVPMDPETVSRLNESCGQKDFQLVRVRIKILGRCGICRAEGDPVEERDMAEKEAIRNSDE